MRTDEHFALVPKWLLESGVTPRAVVLYAHLAASADFNDGSRFIGRKRLSQLLGCSLDSVDRAKTELVKAGALTVVANEGGEGERQTVNTYVVHRKSPESRTDAAPSRTGAEGPAAPMPSLDTDTSLYEKSSTTTTDRRRGSAAPGQTDVFGGGSEALAPTDEDSGIRKVDGKPVTRLELETARAILAAFNEVFGRAYSAEGFLRMIVKQARKHPALTLEDHRALCEKAGRNPWWKDDPSPSVIYGNDKVFERTINMDDAPASRNGKGMSAAAIYEGALRLEEEGR